MATYKIDNQKTYEFPNEFSIVYHADKILVIAPAIPNWIVLDSSRQLYVLSRFFLGHSIAEVLQMQDCDEADIVHVVTQIEARQFYRKVPVIMPRDLSMHLYLTNRCNLACPHCYMFSGKADPSELTTSEIKKLISDFAIEGEGSVLTISGGEPAVRSDLADIVMTAHDAGLDVKLLTNGTLWNSESVAQVAPYLTSVQISIDGFSEVTNAQIRGKGSFEKALATVDSFVSNGVTTAISVTPTLDQLVKHEADYISFAQDLVAKYEDKPFEIRFSEELLNGRCISDAAAIKTEYGKRVTHLLEAIYGSDFRQMEFVKMLSGHRRIENCSYGNLAVSATGDVYLCPRIHDLKPIGNVRSSLFTDLLRKAIEAEESTSVDRLSPCQECDLRFICGGGCRIDEFPGLTSRDMFGDAPPSDLVRGRCDKTYKEKFYAYMIQTNDYFYSDLE